MVSREYRCRSPIVGKFDRLDDGEKLHMQSLGAIAHRDFNNMIADIQRLDLV